MIVTMGDKKKKSENIFEKMKDLGEKGGQAIEDTFENVTHIDKTKRGRKKRR